MSLSINTTLSALLNDEPENSPEITFSAGWEMPDLRSPRLSQRPKCDGAANNENGLFFPEQHRYQRDETGAPMTPQLMAEQSKAFCHGRRFPGDHACPVRTECLEWAMTNWQRRGVWGGLSEPERVKLKEHRALEPERVALLEETRRDQRLEATRRGWETRRRRQAERERGYWIPEAEIAGECEEVRRSA